MFTSSFDKYAQVIDIPNLYATIYRIECCCVLFEYNKEADIQYEFIKGLGHTIRIAKSNFYLLDKPFYVYTMYPPTFHYIKKDIYKSNSKAEIMNTQNFETYSDCLKYHGIKLLV